MCIILQRIRWWGMVGTPFLAFYIAGAIMETSLLVLIKIFLLVCLYIVIHYSGELKLRLCSTVLVT